MSTHRSKFLRITGAGLLAGLLALTGCSGAGSTAKPTGSMQPGTGLPDTTAEPTTTAPASSIDMSHPPSESSGTASPAPTETAGTTTTAPIPHGAVDYADAFIIAWGAGNLDRMKQLSEPAAFAALEHYREAGGPDWEQTGHDAGAGSVFVSYRNSVDGTKVELRVLNEAAAEGQAHAVAEVKFDG